MRRGTRRPTTLRAAIRTQIALAEAGRTSRRTAEARRAAPGSRCLATASVSFAHGHGLLALFVLPLGSAWTWTSPLDAELVADHVRALQVGPSIEVVSDRIATP
jgi:hypothetical protein